MKLIFVSHSSYLQGGAQACLLDLVKGIRKSHPQFQLFLVFPEDGVLIDSFSPYIDGYTVIKQPWWMVSPKQKSVFKSLKRMCKIWRYARQTLLYFKRVDPDVVITNTIASPVAACACKMGCYKHLWFIHEVPVDSGIYSFLYPESRLVRWVEKLSNKILVVSDYTFNHYKALISDSAKIQKIHVAVELNNEPHLNVRNKCYTLLLVGSFDENKGQLEAVAACKELVSTLKQPFHLILVGAVDDAYSTFIRNEVYNTHLDLVVTIVPFLSNITSYYNQADVLLSCSKSEALSRVIIEGQKSGLPIIATSIAAHQELVQDGYNGLLYQRGDVEELVCAIQRLSDPSLRKWMGENAASFMADRYTTKIYVEEFVEHLAY